MKWAFFIGIMIIPKIPMKNRGCKMRNQFMHRGWDDFREMRCILKGLCIATESFFEKEMHWDTGMHRKSNVLSRKRCIRENKCISNHAFGRKYDAYEEIYASQITCFQEKEMHASRIMHRNQHNIPKI